MGELKRRSAGELKRRSAGELKRRSVGELKHRSVGELKRRSVGELKRRSVGELKRRSVGELKRRSAGNSSVEARANSSVVAWENSSIVAWANSSIVAWENSRVEALENSSVVAWANSSVVARGNSRVVARGNSRVEAWGNSSVVARENSSIVAWENSVVRIFSAAVKATLYGFAVAFAPATLSGNIKKESPHTHIQIVEDLGWFERNAIKQTETLTLYKRVSTDFKTQEGTEHETLWIIGSVVTHPSWNPAKAECGGGKFHACSRPYFCDEFRSNRDDRYIAIEAKLADTYEWKDNPEYPHKIGFREGKVLYECDKYGTRLEIIR